MSNILKLSVPGGGPGGINEFYFNASQVIYCTPFPFKPITLLVVSNGKVFELPQSIEEILPHVIKVIKVIKVSKRTRDDVELVYYFNPSQVTWLEPHPVEKTGALIFLNNNNCLQVGQSIEEIVPQLGKVIKVSAQRGEAYYVNASRVVWWQPHPVETGTLIFLNNDRFLHVGQSVEEILPQIS